MAVTFAGGFAQGISGLGEDVAKVRTAQNKVALKREEARAKTEQLKRDASQKAMQMILKQIAADPRILQSQELEPILQQINELDPVHGPAISKILQVRAQLSPQLNLAAGFKPGEEPGTAAAIPGGSQDPTVLEEKARRAAAGTAKGTPPGRSTDLVDFASGTAVLKTKASSSVRANVATVFGGVFDPLTGSIQGLDKDAGRRALAVQVEAERLLLKQIEVTPAAAVQSALKTIEARGESDEIKLPSPQEIDAMPVEQVRELFESLPDDTEISDALAAAIKKKLQKADSNADSGRTAE